MHTENHRHSWGKKISTGDERKEKLKKKMAWTNGNFNARETQQSDRPYNRSTKDTKRPRWALTVEKDGKHLKFRVWRFGFHFFCFVLFSLNFCRSWIFIITQTLTKVFMGCNSLIFSFLLSFVKSLWFSVFFFALWFVCFICVIVGARARVLCCCL